MTNLDAELWKKFSIIKKNKLLQFKIIRNNVKENKG